LSGDPSSLSCPSKNLSLFLINAATNDHCGANSLIDKYTAMSTLLNVSRRHLSSAILLHAVFMPFSQGEPHTDPE
jgi:hypothetical protein